MESESDSVNDTLDSSNATKVHSRVSRSMWAGLFELLGLSAAMATASFVAGSLPILLSLSQKRLKFISALGTGILVGSSLVVIIPEGIEALYSSSSGKAEEHHEEHHEKHETNHAHTMVGPALLSGFLLMYFIDKFPRKGNNTSTNDAVINGPPDNLPAAQSSHISLTELSHHDNDHDFDDAFTPPDSHLLPSVNIPSSGQHDRLNHNRPPATTIGLVIHSAADGIALGASSTVPNSGLNLIIFIAIMIHKAPAAFGMTSVLLRQGLTKQTVRKHLAVFSLAAPLGAVTVWVLVNLLGRHWLGGAEGTKFATGLVLLFSGGTFLYVAMHTIKESPLNSTLEGSASLENGPPVVPAVHSRPTAAEASTAILGMLTPLLTQMGHTH